MNRLLGVLAIFLTFSTLNFSLNNSVYADTDNNENMITWDRKTNIEVDKTWTVTFNKDVDIESVDNEVELISYKGKVELEIEINDNKLVIDPVIDLANGTEYRLIIKNGIKSSDGLDLKYSVEIPFITELNDGNGEIGYSGSFDSSYGVDWNMIHVNYNQFSLDGKYSGEIVNGYSMQEGFSKFGIVIGENKNTVLNKYGKPETFIQKGNMNYNTAESDDYGIYLIDGYYVTFFYDKHENNIIRSMQWIKEELELAREGFYGTPSEEVRKGYEDLMIELMNASRVKEGLDPLKYDRDLNLVARKHSENMAQNNFFDHVNPDGETPADRVIDAGYEVYMVGENLAYGQFSAIYAHEGLMNSIDHRKNILNKDYTHAGVGVSFDEDNSPYFTIKFYTPR